MRHTRSARTTAPRTFRAVAAIGVLVATVAILGNLSRQPEPWSRSSPGQDGRGGQELPTADRGSPVTGQDGVLPDGVTVFDDQHHGVSNLDADLLRALRDAATDAAGEGVVFVVNSGWRSAAYQAQLLRQAVAQHGSEEAAEAWVATPDASAHVSGDAVDLGFAARAWLADHGAAYGLCRVYGNEPWHYELRPEAVDHGCPPPYADAAHDPRTQ